MQLFSADIINTESVRTPNYAPEFMFGAKRLLVGRSENRIRVSYQVLGTGSAAPNVTGVDCRWRRNLEQDSCCSRIYWTVEGTKFGVINILAIALFYDLISFKHFGDTLTIRMICYCLTECVYLDCSRKMINGS